MHKARGTGKPTCPYICLVVVVFRDCPPSAPQCRGDCFKATKTGRQLIPRAGERSGSQQRQSASRERAEVREANSRSPQPRSGPESHGGIPSPAGRSPWPRSGRFPTGWAVRTARLPPGTAWGRQFEPVLVDIYLPQCLQRKNKRKEQDCICYL